eukprot:TRINITY_DN22720_c0_g1_i1.p1 TRINITY_DN22720_c0_g1~~TRINITY_DN22720_c0_g1_i1.p1  ORF type:complete len:146 (+),score=24.91 TRINITY_DN22720_c0_g1_i1:964-1401(+)
MPTDQSYGNPLSSGNSGMLFLQGTGSMFALSPTVLSQCDNIPLQAVCMNQEIIEVARPKKSKAVNRYENKAFSPFEGVDKSIIQEIYGRFNICDIENGIGSKEDERVLGAESIKVPELGGKEGSVLLPKLTLRSLPHFTDALEFR